MDYHWITITGMNVLSYSAGWIYVSTWGRKETVNFITYDEAVSVNGGYVYFD